jgi:hypothetical protein
MRTLIAVITSASAGINSLASALDFSDPRNKVLVSNLEYLLGTTGIGFLHVARRHIAAVTPTVSGWFAQADIAAIDIFATPAGIGLIREIGVPAIEARVREPTGEAMTKNHRPQVSPPRLEHEIICRFSRLSPESFMK